MHRSFSYILVVTLWLNACVAYDHSVYVASIDVIADTNDAAASETAIMPDGSTECPLGLERCAANELCVDLGTSLSNCGGCHVACSPANGVGQCVAGACTVVSCDAHRADCDGDPRNGCEVTLDTSSAHCGSCPHACTGTQVCSAGACMTSCPASTTNCASGCVDTQTDSANCGTCGNRCSAAQRCTSGQCQMACPTGMMMCTAGCVDTTTDSHNCGSCNSLCVTPPHTQGCMSSSCSTACMSGFLDCDNDPATGCEQSSTALTSCGTCTTACAFTADTNFGLIGTLACTNAHCAVDCPTGTGDCDSNYANGCETDVTANSRNCGACGHACPSSQACVDGTCTAHVTYSSYAISHPTVAFIDACAATGHTAALSTVDDVAVQSVLPFQFTLYAVSTTHWWLSSNGIAGPGTVPVGRVGNADCIPFISAPFPIIFGYWSDLFTRPAGVCTTVVGAAPNRQFVATWSDATEWASFMMGDPAGHLTFSLILSETTNTIDVVFNMATGSAGLTGGTSPMLIASAGVQDALGAGSVQFECNQPGTITPGLVIRYTPSP